MTEERNPFEDLFAAWMDNHGHRPDITDEESKRLNAEEEALIHQIISTRAPNVGSIAAKVIVAKQIMEQSGSRWSDERDLKVLDSVLEDLTELGSRAG